MNAFGLKAAERDSNPMRVENASKIAMAIQTAVPLSKTMSAIESGLLHEGISRNSAGRIYTKPEGIES